MRSEVPLPDGPDEGACTATRSRPAAFAAYIARSAACSASCAVRVSVQQHHELVAAHARDGVLLPDARGKRRRDEREHAVAGLVTAAVVDGLEVVEVDEHHRRCRPWRRTPASTFSSSSSIRRRFSRPVRWSRSARRCGRAVVRRWSVVSSLWAMKKRRPLPSSTAPTCTRPHVAAVGVLEALFDGIGPTVDQQRLEALSRHLALIGAEERGRDLADELVGGTPQERAEGGVRAPPPARDRRASVLRAPGRRRATRR